MMRKLSSSILALFVFALFVLSSAVCAGRDNPATNGKPFFRNFTAEEYNGHNRNFDVECDSTGKVYVANFEGLLIWNGLKWTINHTPGISRITVLYLAEDGRLWFGGQNVLGYLGEDDEPFYVASDADSTSTFGEVSAIFTENGRISFCADGARYSVNGGVVEYSPNLKGGRPEDSVWRGVYVNDILDIPELGIQALATESKGLIVTEGDDRVVFTLNTEDGLCDNGVTALKYDGKGSLWGVTDNGIFQLYISSAFSRFGESDGLYGRISSILENNGTLYAGTLQGLFRQEEDGKFKKVEEISLACWNLAEDSSGKVLAATVNGVYRCGPQIQQITQRHTLYICPLPDGSIMTGEIDGIYLLRDGQEDRCLLSSPNICRIERDKEGGILAVNYYQYTYYMAPGSGSFVLNKDKGLSLLLDYADPQGRHWTPNDNGKGLTYKGISDNEKEWCSLLNDYAVDAMFCKGSSAWVGGDFGMMRIDLELIKKLRTFTPRLYLRSFVLDGNNVSYAVSMDKCDPMGTPQFSYRLHNDDKWSKWSDFSEMAFTNLSAGGYQLSVRCRDSYGHIAETEPRIFRIRAPFYLRWYSILLYIMLFSGISFAAMRYRLYKAAKEKERLEAIVEQRTSELKEAQNRLINQEREATVGKLTKGLIDRILNPMNYINNFTLLTKGLVKDIVQDIDDDKEKMSPDIYDDVVDVIGMMNQNLDKIGQHGMATTRILKAMEELLKDQAGKLENTDMEQLCSKNMDVVRSYFKGDIEKFGINVSLEVKSPGICANVNPANMSKVLASVISNSFYAIGKKWQKQPAPDIQPAVTVTLDTGEGGRGSSIRIYDNGIGIEDSIIDKIFDPFFTTKPTSEAPGVGLYLSRQVVQYADGTIRAESKKDEYTTIIITLP